MGFLGPLLVVLVTSFAASNTVMASTSSLSNVTTSVVVPPFLMPWETMEDHVDELYMDDLELASPHVLQSLVEEVRNNEVSILDTVRTNLVKYFDEHASAFRERSTDVTGRTFASLEVALLSLAFLTFAVFLIDLVQDLFNSSGRRLRRNTPEPESSLPDEESTTDLIVLVLSSIDTVANGGTTPDCGQKLLCHLNRSGWNAPGMLGEGANYVTSALFSVFYGTKFEDGLEAAQIGRDEEDCKRHFSECPSIIRGFIPSNEEQSQPTEERIDIVAEEQ